MLSARPAKPVLEAFVDWPAIIEEFEVGMGWILVDSLSGMLAVTARMILSAFRIVTSRSSSSLVNSSEARIVAQKAR